MREIFLTKGISNEGDLDGYIDKVVSEVKSVPENEPFTMLITSFGGDTAQGDRIDRAVREHKGKTIAMIIGAAASMAMNILPAFDERYADPGSELMIHKARYTDRSGEAVKEKDMTSDQKETIKRNSSKMFSRFSAAGVSEDFLSKVYLTSENEDHYLTPTEAEKLGILKVKPIESESELKLAASLEEGLILKSELNQMSIFKKKEKPVMQVAELEDGGMVAFQGIDNKVVTGIVLSAVGNHEPLGKSVVFKGGLKAELNDDDEVVALEEPEAIEDDPMADLAQKVEDNSLAIKALQEAIGASKEADEEAVAEAKAKSDEDDEKMNALKEAQEIVAQGAKDVIEAAATISTTAKLDKFEDKGELRLSGLSPEQERISNMNKIAKGINI